jgi:hypothetical protein
VVALVAVLSLVAQAGPYDADPKHPWNELHEALFTWLPGKPDKIPAGLQSDPLFWPPGQQQWTFSPALLAVLDRFLEKKSDALVKDPLKRAVLQRDLWMFFDALAGTPIGGGSTWPPEDDAARDRVRPRIARLLRRLALSPEEIRALPDTLAAAVASGRFLKAFDPAEPERPFLPADLLDPNGPWVLLGREDGAPAAEQHAKAFRGRSLFLLYASVPGGPEPTLDFIRKLGALNKEKPPAAAPEGTRLLFVRRSFLLDVAGTPQLSPLTEEVRIRVQLAKPGPGAAGRFEYHLNRADLFAGVGGGLRAAEAEEQGILLFFNRGVAKERIRPSCSECHGHQAIPQAALRYGGHDRQAAILSIGIPLRTTTVDQEADATRKARQGDKSWEFLRRSWPKE